MSRRNWQVGDLVLVRLRHGDVLGMILNGRRYGHNSKGHRTLDGVEVIWFDIWDRTHERPMEIITQRQNFINLQKLWK